MDTDYSNTIIYKITCKDPDVKDIYVGHTTNFVQRKKAHCISSNLPSSQCKLYKTIRENGGWANWNMDIVHFFSCANQQEARIKEQEFFVSLQATLNSVEPFPICPKKQLNNTAVNHEPKKYKKMVNKFYCSYCDYIARDSYNFLKHNNTTKHKQLLQHVTPETKYNTNPTIIQPQQYPCSKCNKKYNHRGSLFKHNKRCIPIKTLDQAVIQTFMMQNTKDLHHLALEQIKTISQLINILINQQAPPPL